MKQEIELYIHIPFCVKKCNYCDFLSFPSGTEQQEKYALQLIKELTFRSPLCGEYAVSSVFIGGGTPSIISEKLIAEIMQTIDKYYYVKPDMEVTIECNPASAMRHKFTAYRNAGINRLSIGLQSADNAELKMLGRIHTFEDFLKSYQSARMEGFTNINIDLINCFPMQSIKTWKKTLRNVLMLKPEHVSVYNLIVEEGTPFYDMREKGLLLMPTEEEQAEIDSFTAECMARYGFGRYEFSNYSRPGRECRHNIGYWTGVPYIGFGIGAASYFGGMRWKNTSDIGEYMEIDLGGDADEACGRLMKDTVKLTRENRMEEFMFLGMRMLQGVSAGDFRKNFAAEIENVFGAPLKKGIEQGLIEAEGDRYRLTKRGIEVSNVVLSEFLLG